MVTRDDENVMIYIIYRTPERENLFKWVGPIIPPYNMYFYKLKERKKITITTLNDAKIHRIGVVRNVANHKYLLDRGFEDGKQLYPVTDARQNILKLFRRRIDLLISNELNLTMQLKEVNLRYDALERVYSVLESQAGYMGFNKQTPDRIVDIIQNAFDEVKEEGVVDSIKSEYMKMYR